MSTDSASVACSLRALAALSIGRGRLGRAGSLSVRMSQRGFKTRHFHTRVGQTDRI
jgi:hypothetical protein